LAAVVFGSTTQVKRRSWTRAAVARAMPKFPDELSTRWLAAVMVPSARPRSTM